jgi:hypothetical protein
LEPVRIPSINKFILQPVSLLLSLIGSLILEGPARIKQSYLFTSFRNKFGLQLALSTKKSLELMMPCAAIYFYLHNGLQGCVGGGLEKVIIIKSKDCGSFSQVSFKPAHGKSTSQASFGPR